jgi:hypothetical protein
MTLKTRQQVTKAITLSLTGMPLDPAEAMQLIDTANELLEMGMEARRYGEERCDEDMTQGGRRLTEVGLAMKTAVELKERRRA